MGNKSSTTSASDVEKGEESASRPLTVIVIEEGTVNSADDSAVDVGFINCSDSGPASDHFPRKTDRTTPMLPHSVAVRGQASENKKDAEALKPNQRTRPALKQQERWQEFGSSVGDSHSGSWDRSMLKNSLDGSLKASNTGQSMGQMLSLGQFQEITEKMEDNTYESTAGGSSGCISSRSSSSADEGGCLSSVNSGAEEEEDNNVDDDSHNVDSIMSNKSLPDPHSEYLYDGGKKDDNSEKRSDETVCADEMEKADLNDILQSNALMTRGRFCTTGPSNRNSAAPADTTERSPRTIIKRQIQAVAQNSTDKFIQRGAASRHTITRMALQSSASLRRVISTNEWEGKEDDGKAEEERSKEDDAPFLPLFEDILSEGCHYLSLSMLVYIYAQLREMAVLGFTEKQFSAIDVNTAQRQEKKGKKDGREWKRGPTKRRSSDDSGSVCSVLSMASLEEEMAPPFNAPTPRPSLLLPSRCSSTRGSLKSAASSIASVEGGPIGLYDEEEENDDGNEELIGNGKISMDSGRQTTATHLSPSALEFKRPLSPPMPAPPALTSSDPQGRNMRYTGNSLSAGAIIRVVLEELELDEKKRSMSQRQLEKPTRDDELVGFERQHDTSILREFRQWVDDSRGAQLDEAAKNAILELRRKVARARWKRSVSAVRISFRLIKMISDPDLKSGLDETEDGPGTASDEGKADQSIRRSVAVRRPALSRTKTVKGNWFKLQRRLLEDHFGVNDDLENVTTEDGDIIDENHTAASKESQRLSNDILTKNMIDEVIDETLPSYFKKGSVLSQMLESGIEVVWFGDRHPNEAIYCICINRQHKMVTVVFRGSVNAHNWLHNMKLMMTDHHNPIANEDYHGRADRFNLHTGFGLYMLRRRKDDGRRKIDEIFRKVHAIGKEIANDGNYRVAVTGHSLGGALSTIFSFYAALEERFTRVAPVRVFTFAAPRVGDQNFLDAYTQLERTGRLLHARFMNTCDLVPLTPWRSLNGFKVGLAYKHVGMQIRLHKMDFYGKTKIRNALDTSYAGNQGWWFALERVLKNNVITNITTIGGFKQNHDISELQRRIHFARQYRLGLGHSDFFTDKRRRKLKTLEEYYRLRANIPFFESGVDSKAPAANLLGAKHVKIIIVLLIVLAAAPSMLWPTPTYHERTYIDFDAHGSAVFSDVESALLTLNHGEGPMDMAVHLEGHEVNAPVSFPMEQHSVRKGRNTTIEETPREKLLTSEGGTHFETITNLDSNLMDTAAHPTQILDAFNWALTIVRTRAFRVSMSSVDDKCFGRPSFHGSVAHVLKSRCSINEAQRAVKLWEARSFAKEFTAQESQEKTLAALKEAVLMAL